MNNTTTLEIGQSLVIEGEVRTIVSIKGRWVKLSDDTSISRGEAFAYRADYNEEYALLGDELASEDDQDEASEDTSEAADDQDDTDADDEGSDEGEDEEATGYQGSMLRLRERLAEGAYQKAANGQPCCGDQVATLLGALAPAQVIRACIMAMALPSNPYIHLNIGQQSMNLRNKLRGCFKRCEFGMGVLIEAVETVQDEDAKQKNEAGLLSDAQWQMVRGEEMATA